MKPFKVKVICRECFSLMSFHRWHTLICGNISQSKFPTFHNISHCVNAKFAMICRCRPLYFPSIPPGHCLTKIASFHLLMRLLMRLETDKCRTGLSSYGHCNTSVRGSQNEKQMILFVWLSVDNRCRMSSSYSQPPSSDSHYYHCHSFPSGGFQSSSHIDFFFFFDKSAAETKWGDCTR